MPPDEQVKPSLARVKKRQLHRDERASARERSRAAIRRWRVLVVGVAALVIGWQVLAPPIVGVADNGDFGKLIARYDLGNHAAWTYIAQRYQFDSGYRYDSGFSSSELLPIRAALAMNRVLSKDGSFDIRIMGIVHGALFLLAFYFFVPVLADFPAGTRLVLAAGALFFFCDVMYVSYLNSFYMDTISLVMMLWAVVFYLRTVRWRRWADAALLVASCLMLIGSKPQYAVLAIWLAGLFWAARDELWRGRKAVAAVVCVGLVVGGWISFRFGAPLSYQAKACFNVVFTQILPSSKDLPGTMAALGLDDSYRQWIGKNAYSPGSPLEDPAFYEPLLRKISYPRIGWFYFHHPADGWRALRHSLDEAGRQRPAMGNFDAGAGLPPGSESQAFAVWSGWKQHLFYARGNRFLFSFLGLAALIALLLGWQRETLSRAAVSGAVALMGMALSCTLIASLGDTFDMPRHHLVFYALFDVMVLIALWLGMRIYVARWDFGSEAPKSPYHLAKQAGHVP